MGLKNTIRRWLDIKNPEGWDLGGGNDAGVSVTESSALNVVTANRCVRLISETVATLPVSIYEKQDDGRVEAKKHALHGLIKHSPNTDQTSVDFMESVAGCISLRGNAYVLKGKNGTRITSLTPLNPDAISISRDSQNRKRYHVTANGKRNEYTEDEILHISGFKFFGNVGLSPVAQAAQTLGISLAADKSAASMLKDGGRPRGALGVDNILTAQQREDIRSNVMPQFSKAMENGGTMVLEAGMKYQAISFKPDELQMLESRQFNVEEVCRAFGVPPVLVGHSSSGQTMYGAGVEHIMIAWLQTSLRSTLVRIEKALEKQLLTSLERQTYSIRFNVNGLLRGDTKARAEYYSTLVSNGIMTRNEVRALEDMKRADGLDGYTVQQAMATIDAKGQIIAPVKSERQVV